MMDDDEDDISHPKDYDEDDDHSTIHDRQIDPKDLPLSRPSSLLIS